MAARIAACRHRPRSLVLGSLGGDDRGQSCARADTKLVVDAGEVALDGLLAQEQRRGDISVSLAGGDEIRDLPLTRAECVRSRGAGNATEAPRWPAAETAQLSGGCIGFAQRAKGRQRPLGVL